MRLVESVFGKHLDLLTVNDIETFFLTPQEESDRIEFKSYHQVPGGRKEHEERLSDVIKTITGFLNSGGGFIIWGSPKPQTGEQGNSIVQGPLTPFTEHYTKDQFIGRIADIIIPSPQGVFFRSFEKDGKYFYIIEVLPSNYAPHQFKNIYYMRMDGSTKAAPHHYIEALFKKISFPNLEAYLRLDAFNHIEYNAARLKCTIIFRNQSPFQNEFDLHYRVFTSHGSIRPEPMDTTFISKGIPLTGQGDYKKKVSTIIYYGEWLHDTFNVILSRDKLHENNYDLHIRLQFGGRDSPMKLSFYTINIGEKVNLNLQSHIMKMYENKFFNIYEEEMSIPDKERLLQVLGRDKINE